MTAIAVLQWEREISAALTISAYVRAMRLASAFCLGGLAVLTACGAAPGPDYAGLSMTRVSIEGSDFDIRVKGTKAQAIRVNSRYAPRLGPIGAQAAFAIQQVSGCAVTRIKGDAAVLVGTLRCPDQPKGRTPPLATGRASLECHGVESYESAATGEIIASYDCDWHAEPRTY